jgi:hypothetical protein
LRISNEEITKVFPSNLQPQTICVAALTILFQIYFLRGVDYNCCYP